jgi:hypothetical protein
MPMVVCITLTYPVIALHQMEDHLTQLAKPVTSVAKRGTSLEVRKFIPRYWTKD